MAVSQTNKYGMTCLHLAAYDGNLPWVRECLEEGLNVDTRDRYGHTPLHWAADMSMAGGDREAVFAALIQAGSDVNAREGEDGRTILMVACSAGNQSIVDQLIEAGADVNARTDNSTALIEAACYGGPETTRLLLLHGAEISAKDGKGRTALDNARAYKWDDVSSVLETAEEVSGKK